LTSIGERDRPSLTESRWITDYDDGHEVLRSAQFGSSLGSGMNRPLSADILLVLTGDEHLARRRAEIVLFNRKLQETYEFDLVKPAIEDLLRAVTSDDDDWVKVDMMALARAAMVRVSAQVIGIDGIDSPETVEDLLHLAHKIGESFAVDWAVRPAAEIMEEAFAASDSFVERHFTHSLERRRATPETGVAESGDLLSLLLKHYPGWDDALLLRECMFYLSASAGTSTNTVPHVIMNILGYFDEHPDKRVLAQDLSFLQRSVTETLRLNPPQPALTRRALEDVVLSSGTAFAKDEFFRIDLNALNRDERFVGERADEFDPYRTLAPRTPRFGASFGSGPHFCPGRLVAVGQGTGEVEDEARVSGAITRLCQSLFGFDVRIDPADLPTLRTDTSSRRYATFNILVRPRPDGCEPFITGR
jgi:cytochrome P450